MLAWLVLIAPAVHHIKALGDPLIIEVFQRHELSLYIRLMPSEKLSPLPDICLFCVLPFQV